MTPGAPAEPSYEIAKRFWEGKEPTVSGMLDGFDELHQPDVKESLAFLAKIPGLRYGSAIDCGCGIGRITRNVLAPKFSKVACVDDSERFLKELEPEFETFCSSLQSFTPSCSYDLVWIQWVFLYLSDEESISFLQRCRSSQVIVLKENIVKGGRARHTDMGDGSVTRSREEFEYIFERAGFNVIVESKQKEWPQGMFPVLMWALRAKASQ